MAKNPFYRIIPQPQPKPPSWANYLFVFSLLVLLASVSVFFVLKQKTNSLFQKSEELEETIPQLMGKPEKNLEKQVFVVKKKIETFFNLLKDRPLPSKFFPFFESKIHHQVQVTGLNVDLATFQVSFSGRTPNFTSLGEQILILKQSEGISNVILTNVSFEREGDVGFSISFSFSPNVLK